MNARVKARFKKEIHFYALIQFHLPGRYFALSLVLDSGKKASAVKKSPIDKHVKPCV